MPTLQSRSGRVNFAWLAFLASVAVLVVLVGLLAWDSWRRDRAAPGRRPLLVYCAAGIRPPVEAAARDYGQDYGVDAAQVTEGARFFADLDADSLDVVELVMAIEERPDVTIPEDELDEINTVGDAVTAVLDKLAARTG